MIGNRKDEIQRREMMIYFIQIKRFRVFVGSHLVTGQNKNPLQNYDIDIYCISIQGTKKRRRRFFYYGTCWGANLRIHKKKRLLPLFLPPIHQHPSPQSLPKKKHPRRLRSRTHKISCTCSMTKTSWCFEKRSVLGGGGKIYKDL